MGGDAVDTEVLVKDGESSKRSKLEATGIDYAVIRVMLITNSLHFTLYTSQRTHTRAR